MTKFHPLFRGGARCLLLLAAMVLAAHAAAGDWSLKGQDGIHYKLSALHGKWVLVNFWAPWCPPCLQELPELQALHQRYPNLQVIGVAVMYENNKEVNDAVQKYSVTYPMILGNEDIASDFAGMAGMPTSFLYSPDGQLVHKFEGPITKDEIVRMIK